MKETPVLARRNALAIAGLAPLAACATSATGSGGQSTFSLAQAQAQVQAIDLAIDQSNTLAQASAALTPAQKQTAATLTAALDASAAAFEGITAGSNGAQTAQSVIAAITNVLPVIAPILGANPTTAIAISLGLAIVQAFAGEIALPANVTVTPTTAAIAGRILAPVAVPLPH